MKNLKLFEAKPSFGDLENRVKNRYRDEVRKYPKTFVTFGHKSKENVLISFIQKINYK